MAKYGLPGRSPHGERGLKSSERAFDADLAGRSPHGERGLKSARGPRHLGPGHVALLMESVD